MKNSDKKIRNAAVLLLSALLFTACGRDGAKEEDGSTEPPETVQEETGGEFQVREITVPVEGLSREYRFLYLSDTHMIVPSEEDSEEIAGNAAPRLELFKDKDGSPSAARFPEWVDYANEQKVDMVLFGGDMIDYPSDANLQFLQENLQNLQMPYLYAMGNHDWTYPWEYMTEEGRKKYRPLFDSMMEGDAAARIVELEELVLLTVDNSSNQVDPQALEKAGEAYGKGKPVLALVHVPFSTDALIGAASQVWQSPVSIGYGSEGGGIVPDAASAAFYELLTSEESTTAAVLAGHVHFYHEDLLEGRVKQYTADAGYQGAGMLITVK